MTARFITFEGGEGTGKSTQIQLLATALREKGISVLTTREPGGSPGAEEIRSLLVKGEEGRWDGVCEALLMFASRRDHWIKTILPALEKGTWVLCDRFADSSFVYQGYARGVSQAFLKALYDHTVGERKPDRTYIFDIDPSTGLSRTLGRGGDEDRFEGLDISFHQRVREGYLKLAAREPSRCYLVDASQDVADIHQHILADMTYAFL